MRRGQADSSHRWLSRGSPEQLVELLPAAARTPGGEIGLLKTAQVARILGRRRDWVHRNATRARRLPVARQRRVALLARRASRAASSRRTPQADADGRPTPASAGGPSAADSPTRPPSRRSPTARGARRHHEEDHDATSGTRKRLRSSTARTDCGRSGLRITVDGRRHRVRLGTDRDGWTPARAQVELEEQQAAVRAGTWTPPDAARAPATTSDPTFRAYASSWLEDNMLEWRPSTVNDVTWRLESHLLPHDRRGPPVDLRHPARHRRQDRAAEGEPADRRRHRRRRHRARRAQHAAATAV